MPRSSSFLTYINRASRGLFAFSWFFPLTFLSCSLPHLRFERYPFPIPFGEFLVLYPNFYFLAFCGFIQSILLVIFLTTMFYMWYLTYHQLCAIFIWEYIPILYILFHIHKRELFVLGMLRIVTCSICYTLFFIYFLHSVSFTSSSYFLPQSFISLTSLLVSRFTTNVLVAVKYLLLNYSIDQFLTSIPLISLVECVHLSQLYVLPPSFIYLSPSFYSDFNYFTFF